MPATPDNLLTRLRHSLLKSAASALPSAPKVPNPAPQPPKTPSFTTQPPTVGKAVADVRPGLSSTVTPKTQSLGTAKATGAKQVSVSKPIMAPKEFKAIPAVPLAKTAQVVPAVRAIPDHPATFPITPPNPQPKAREPQLAPARMVTPQLRNLAFGSVSRTTGEAITGHGSYAGARDWLTYSADKARAAEAAKAKAYAAEQAKANQTPENPHYANRPAQLQAQAARQRQEALEGYAKGDPTVVKRMTDAQVKEKMNDYRSLGSRIRGLFGKDSGVGDYLHDSANTMEVMANGFQQGADWALSKGMKWLDPRSWGSSVSAQKNRLSHDNDWANAQRIYDERHKKLVNGMILGDTVDPRAQAMLNVQRGLGEFAGGTAVTGGAGKILGAAGQAGVRAGTVGGFRAGRAIAAGAQRLGASKNTAGALTRFGTNLGKNVGQAATAPVRYAGAVLSAPGKASAGAVGAAGRAVAHPVQAGRAVASGVRTAGRYLAHPGHAAKAIWRKGPITRGLDAYMYGQNAYDVGQGVMTGDFGRAAGSAADVGWYGAMRRLNPWIGMPLAFAPAIAQVAFSDGTDTNPEE